MKIDRDLLKRFKLFGSGMVIGITFLIFFLNGKKSSCNWFPNARALEYIRQKNIEYSPQLTKQISNKEIDSSAVNYLLLNGDINFSKSKQRQKPCKKYWINGVVKSKEVVLHVKICDSIAILSKLNF